MAADESNDQLFKSGLKHGKSMTTGVGTRRFAAPEQIQRVNNRKKDYCFKADIYSLGVVLLDIFRDHNISMSELNRMHEIMLTGKVEEELAKTMPEQAVDLIEKMVS